MKLTQEDLSMFKALNKAEIGRSLLDYVDRLIDSAYDVRTWMPGDSAESAKAAANLLKVQLRDRIALQNKESVVVNEGE
jgi:hypothetical protein